METRRFRRDASAPERVRRLVSRHVGGVREFDAALLAASEIATNAVRYGEAGVPDVLQATVLRESDSLTVEVTGRGSFDPGCDGQAAESRAGIGGFGLALVEALSSDWGVEQRGRRVRVWFTIDGLTSRRPRTRG